MSNLGASVSEAESPHLLTASIEITFVLFIVFILTSNLTSFTFDLQKIIVYSICQDISIFVLFIIMCAPQKGFMSDSVFLPF